MALTMSEITGQALKILGDNLVPKEYKLHPPYWYCMPRHGQYEVWKDNKRITKGIKHRKEAIAMCKLLNGVR